MSISMAETPTVQDRMVTGDRMPTVNESDIVKVALEVMSTKKLGFCCVIDYNGVLAGVFTDGDLRRLLLKHQRPFSSILVDDIKKYMATQPTTVTATSSLSTAVEKMYRTKIWDLPVVDEKHSLVGVLHMHAALNPGTEGLNTADYPDN